MLGVRRTSPLPVSPARLGQPPLVTGIDQTRAPPQDERGHRAPRIDSRASGTRPVAPPPARPSSRATPGHARRPGVRGGRVRCAGRTTAEPARDPRTAQRGLRRQSAVGEVQRRRSARSHLRNNPAHRSCFVVGSGPGETDCAQNQFVLPQRPLRQQPTVMSCRTRPRRPSGRPWRTASDWGRHPPRCRRCSGLHHVHERSTG